MTVLSTQTIFDSAAMTELKAYVDGHTKIVFAVIRNEVDLVRAWVAHYRTMGISKIVVIDNASTDGTGDLLRELGAFTLCTDQSYASSGFGMRWLGEFLEAVPEDTIVINVDADELLVYDGWPNVGIDDFLRDFESSDCDTIFAFMLDMYPDGPLRSVREAADRDLFSIAPMHDSDYVFRHRPRSPWRRDARPIEILGGPRVRMLSSLNNQKRSTWLHYLAQRQLGRIISVLPCFIIRSVVKYFPKQMPELGKYPIFKVKGFKISNIHLRTGTKMYTQNALLCHFKFMPSFLEKCYTEIQRGEHFRRGAEYILYSQALQKLPDGDLRYPGSVQFSPKTLKSLQIFRDISEFT